MLPLISVVVPVYNVEKYLTQCVESLVAQSYKNIEILLIDDGSRDGSGMLCDQFAKKYSNVAAYHKNNTGLGLTRNYGLERIKGDYVTFVDSDDYLAPDAVQQLVDGLKHGENDTVIGGFTKITDKGEKIYVESYPKEDFNDEECYSKVFCKMLGSSPKEHDSIKASVWNVLYSTSLIKRNHISFVSERQYISEDIVWDSDYFKYSTNTEIIDSTAYYYRSNPTSLSKTYRPDRFEKCVVFFEYMTNKMVYTKICDEARLRLTKNLFINVRSCFALEKERSFHEIKQSIRKICSNFVLQEAIKAYPVSQLGISQKVFIHLVKNKCVTILAVLSKYGLLE